MRKHRGERPCFVTNSSRGVNARQVKYYLGSGGLVCLGRNE
jgi:hypothetical protein